MMISRFPAIHFLLQVFITLSYIRDAVAICPDGYFLFGNGMYTAMRCIKVSSERKTWAEADQICKSDLGHLIDLKSSRSLSFINTTTELMVNFSNFTFEKGVTEFWTGMHIREGRLVWDGFPVQIVSKSLYSSQLNEDWSWDDGEPSELGECGRMKQVVLTETHFDKDKLMNVTMTHPSGKYLASLALCEKMLPFVCERFETSPENLKHTSNCPDGWIGSRELVMCYRIFRNSLTFEGAADYCRELKGYMMTTDSEFDRIISRSVYDWHRNNDAYFGKGTFSVWVNKTRFCNAMSSEDIIDSNDCDSSLPFACQVPTRYQLPEEITVSSPYENQRELLNYSPFAPLPVTLKMSRPPTENEKLIVELSGQEVSDGSFISVREGSSFESPYFVNLTIPVQVQFTRRRRASILDDKFGRGDNNILNGSVYSLPAFNIISGYYSFRLYSLNPPHVLRTNPVLVRYAEPDVFIYVMTVTMSPMKTLIIPSQNAVAFNLCRDYSYISSISERLNFSLNDIRQQVVYRPPWLTSLNSYNAYIEYVQPSDYTVRLRLFLTFRNGRNLSLDFEQYIRSEMQTLLTQLANSSHAVSSVRVRSTVACPTLELNETISSTPIIIPFTRINFIGYSWNRCLPGTRALAFAPCLGDYDKGAHWGDVIFARNCQEAPNLENSNQSLSLKNLSKTPIDINNVNQVINNTAILTSARGALKDADVIYTAQILENLQQISSLPSKALDDVIKVANNMLELDPGVVHSAQKISSAANRILRAVDDLTKNTDLLGQNSRRIVQPYVAAEIWEQTQTNIIGLELIQGNWKQIENGSLNTLKTAPSNLQKIDAAIYIDPELVQGSTSRLAMQVYWDNKMFADTSGRYETISRVAAVRLSINRKPIVDLGNKTVTAIFLPYKEHVNIVCGYWNYTGNENAGGWSTEGCLHSVNSGRHICTCNHLTNFAVLIDLQPDRSISEADKLALGVITKIGLGLSIVGLGLTILSFLIFRNLRKGRGQKTLVCLCFAMLGSAILFLVGIDRTETYGGCITVSVLLHYFILASFMWMLMEGMLQYLRFVKVLGTYIPKFMIKTSIPAWGMPLIPVIVLLAVDYNLYYGGRGYCWMQLYPLYWAFILPIGLILVANFIVFVLVIVNLCRRPRGMQVNQSDHKIAVMNLQAGLAVFVLLGLTWVFGFLAVEDARVALMYVFAFLNAFQGFFVFLLFTAREKQVRQSWARLCCKKKSDVTSTSATDSRGLKYSVPLSQSTNLSNERSGHA
ncbi:hypothetical protein CHS0354_040642 [Potamilus streckersoni]|uniref:Uncharacterized protein n=1 Tax=Potamilus streckersoni TaxID=2493646 RepID=A0AAE0TCA3_9BIVA|nr:hypothetical protein CHS0354_040642 [Potamilus streckersoni]